MIVFLLYTLPLITLIVSWSLISDRIDYLHSLGFIVDGQYRNLPYSRLLAVATRKRSRRQWTSTRFDLWSFPSPYLNHSRLSAVATTKSIWRVWTSTSPDKAMSWPFNSYQHNVIVMSTSDCRATTWAKSIYRSFSFSVFESRVVFVLWSFLITSVRMPQEKEWMELQEPPICSACPLPYSVTPNIFCPSNPVLPGPFVPFVALDAFDPVLLAVDVNPVISVPVISFWARDILKGMNFNLIFDL